MLGIIKEKLRPVLMRKWRTSRANVVSEAMEAGLSDEQLELVLRGFRIGYWSGAVDASSIKPADLHQDPQLEDSKVH